MCAPAKTTSGCLFCADAPEADFDWCRVCGRDAPEEALPHPDDLKLPKWLIVTRELLDTLRANLG